jgi:hypothetical protein
MLDARVSKQAPGYQNGLLAPSPSEDVLFAQLECARAFSIAGLPVIKRLAPSHDGHDLSMAPKLAIGSHLGYGRIDLSIRTVHLSDPDFLRVTKSLLSDKHLWYERATESTISLTALLGYLPVLTVACESCKVNGGKTVEFVPLGGPHGAYARYIKILTDRMNRVIVIPTNEADGKPFSLRHSGIADERGIERVEAALAPFIEVLKRHLALSPSRPYLFGGAIGVCLKDTAEALGIRKEHGILLDEASYTNFPEELPLEQSHEAWRAQTLEDAPHPRLVLEDLRSTYSPARTFETRQLGFPVLRFQGGEKELE